MIITIKEKDNVVLAYSNLNIVGYFNSDDDYVEEDNMALKVNKSGQILAFANLDRISQALIYDDHFLSIEITPQSLVRQVIPYIKNKIKQCKIPLKNSTDWENSLTVITENHIYDLTPKYVFTEINDYVYHGYRGSFKNVLEQTKNLPSRQRILNTITFCGKIDKNILFPLVITDAKTKKIIKCFKEEDIYVDTDSV